MLRLGQIKYDRTIVGRTGKNGVLALTGTLFQGTSRLLTNVLLGRLEGPELLGLTQSVMSTASLGSLLLPTSAGSAASKYIAFYRGKGDYETARAAAEFIAKRTIQATVAILAIVLVVSNVFNFGGISTSIVTGLLLLGMCGQAFVRGIHYGTGQVRRLVTWDVGASILSLVAVVTLLAFGVRSVWILAPIAVITLVFVFISWPQRSAVRITKISRRDIDRFMALGVVGTVSSSGFLQSSVLVAAWLNGLHYAGEYSAALTLTTPISLVAGAISLVLFPAMASDHGSSKPDSVKRRTNFATHMIITMMIAMFGTIGILAQPLTSFVWGSNFGNSDEILVILLLAVVLGTIAVPSVNALTAKSNRGMAISATSSLFGFGMGALTWLILANALSNYAVPIGYLVGAMLISTIPYVYVWRTYRHQWLKQTLTAIAALGMIIGIIVATRLYDLSFWGLILVTVLFLAVWCALRANDVRTIGQLLLKSVRRERPSL